MKKLSQASIDIDGNNKSIKAFICIRNEKFRLAYFLDYYRDLGVEEFYFVDNGSTDGTVDYLLSQQDVHLFQTLESYRDSNAGRNWTTALANKYGLNCWCLTLDVDEFFIYPYSEHVGLRYLIQYLEKFEYKGMFCIFLDHYSNKQLSDTVYNEGQNIFEVSRYYDSSQAYTAYNTHYFPYFQIRGGMRQRHFWDARDYKSGPSMRKIPLVYWQPGFDYIHSTHSSSDIPLADITGVLSHFKFVSSFKVLAKAEYQRNDRRNPKDYKMYADRLSSNDLNFHDQNISRQFTDSAMLIKDRMLACTVKYFDYVFQQKLSDLEHTDARYFSEFQSIKNRQRNLMTSHVDQPVSYDNLIAVWPAIQEFQASSGGLAELSPQDKTAFIKMEKKFLDSISSPSWRMSRPLRKLGWKLGLFDQRALIEDCYQKYDLATMMDYTYGSIWWDLTGPVRVVSRTFNKIKSKFFRQ